MGDPDILAFWFGEPDEVTPAFIRDEAMRSLTAGETFYTPISAFRSCARPSRRMSGACTAARTRSARTASR